MSRCLVTASACFEVAERKKDTAKPCSCLRFDDPVTSQVVLLTLRGLGSDPCFLTITRSQTFRAVFETCS